MEQSWIKDIRVQNVCDMENRNASSEVFMTLEDIWKNREDVNSLFLWARIEDRSGREVDSIFPLVLEEELAFCMRVSDPVFWNAENSYCYRVVCEVRDDQQRVLESVFRYVAYYKWEVKDGDCCLDSRKVDFRSRRMPLDCESEEEIKSFLKNIKRDFYNAVLVESEQNTAFLKERCMEYGIYLIAPGEHLDYGRICAEMEQCSQEEKYEWNPDFSICVTKDGALIENRSTFVNTMEYQLIFEVLHDGQEVQKGKIHVDIPAGESRYVTIPYMELHTAGEFTYRVSLCLEKGVLWEEEGYTVAFGENKITNLFL